MPRACLRDLKYEGGTGQVVLCERGVYVGQGRFCVRVGYVCGGSVCGWSGCVCVGRVCVGGILSSTRRLRGQHRASKTHAGKGETSPVSGTLGAALGSCKADSNLNPVCPQGQRVPPMGYAYMRPSSWVILGRPTPCLTQVIPLFPGGPPLGIPNLPQPPGCWGLARVSGLRNVVHVLVLWALGTFQLEHPSTPAPPGWGRQTAVPLETPSKELLRGTARCGEEASSPEHGALPEAGATEQTRQSRGGGHLTLSFRKIRLSREEGIPGDKSRASTLSTGRICSQLIMRPRI